MSNIPKARAELRLVAKELRAGTIGPGTAARVINAVVRQYMTREPPVRKVSAKSKTLTPALAKKIRAFASMHDDMSMHWIGLKFGVNQGRVSEALNRKV